MEEKNSEQVQNTENESLNPAEAQADEQGLGDLENTDGSEFAARYESAKEKDIEKLSKEMEERSSNKTKKQKWKTALKFIFLFALIGLSIGLMFGLGDYLHDAIGFTEMLKTTFSWKYFLLLIAAVAGYIIFESLKYSYLLKISTGKWRLKNSLKVMLLGKYYDGITPLGTGGQPFQIYYLHKRNVPAGAATAVPLVKYIITTFVFGLTCGALLGLAPSQFQSNGTIADKLNLSFMIIAWISFAINMLVPTAMILLSAFPKFGKKVIVWLVKVLHKMHIVKHKYSVTKKYVYEVAEYRNALKLFLRKWYLLIPLVLITVIETAIYLSLPFFSVTAIAGIPPTGELLVQIWSLAVVSFYAASWIPTPGSSGAAEMSSFFVFSTVAGIESVLGWVVFTWRFANFYLYILIGICMTVFSMIRDGVRAKRARKIENQENSEQ